MHRGMFSVLEDIIDALGGTSSVHLGDIISAFGRYQYCCGTHPMHDDIPHINHDIPQCTDNIPLMHCTSPNAFMVHPQCTDDIPAMH